MTATRYLLDTSALLAHYRQETGWERVQALFEDDGAEVLAASLSLTEFARRLREFGASADEARDTVNSYMVLLDELVPVDERVALAAFDLTCEVSPRLPLADALVAAAARERSARLVHRDQHMRAIPPHSLDQLDLAQEPAT